MTGCGVLLALECQRPPRRSPASSGALALGQGPWPRAWPRAKGLPPRQVSPQRLKLRPHSHITSTVMLCASKALTARGTGGGSIFRFESTFFSSVTVRGGFQLRSNT